MVRFDRSIISIYNSIMSDLESMSNVENTSSMENLSNQENVSDVERLVTENASLKSKVNELENQLEDLKNTLRDRLRLDQTSTTPAHTSLDFPIPKQHFVVLLYEGDQLLS
ncbi:hypothetical protein NPIL_498121 [Nephila pilipes]|uniref:Uncharacterized protein n=1 Tax=Nephila pilipes TaxID=299642 RepID=A0A8X6IGW8_NEPPI|nr:hypothetical protein NPIL_498121 [Nephila pilipes]